MIRRLAFAAIAATLASASGAPTAQAQKALVYCPVGVDAAGCDRVVAALQSQFVGGVDRGYDGSGGTIDVRKVDLQHYAVFVVPSLADAAGRTPYALLRAAAPQLRMALTGRVAVYSGAPDQGNGNRPDKETLIQSLAGWAGDGHTRKTGLVGLVALLDLSDNVAGRYSWVRAISAADVSADAELNSFGTVHAETDHGRKVVEPKGKPIIFPNMASYGLHIGARAAARTLVGATAGAGPNKQSILVQFTTAENPPESSSSLSNSNESTVTSSGGSRSLSPNAPSFSLASAGDPTLTTDKPDYYPGDTVTFSGTGWAPGDTVVITVHEDPTWSYPDRQFTAIAGDDGSFTNRDMIVDRQDLGATFTATAVANPSGLVAQTTFTDGVVSFGFATAGNAAPNTITWTATWNQSNGTGQNPNLTCSGAVTTNGSTTYVGPTRTPSGGSNAEPSINNNQSLLVTGATVTGAFASQYVFDYWSATAASTSPIVPACVSGTQGGATIATYYAHFRLTTQATTVGSITASASTFGGTTNLSATVSPSGVAGSIAFYVNGSATAAAGTVSYNSATGVATLSNYAHGLNASVTPYSVRAVFTSSDAGFTGSEATNSSALTVGKANQTITFTSTAPSAAVYGGTYAVTATGVGTGNPVTFGTSTPSVCTGSASPISFVGVDSCTVTADQAGNSNYNAATQATQTFDVGRADQTISFTKPSNMTYGDADQTLIASASSTLAVAFSAAPASVCSIVSGKLHAVGFGTCTVSADQPGNSNYNAAPQVSYNDIAISKRAVTATGITAANRPYNGTTTASISGGSLTGVVAGDVGNVSLDLSGATASFASKTVGTGKTVSISGLALSGTAAGSYALTETTASATANITALGITGSFTVPPSKPYDATTAATVSTRNLSGVLGTDVVTLNGGTAAYDNKNVGTNKTVTLSGATLAGADAGNYSLSSVSTTTAAITALGITGSFTVPASKPYDGTNAATVSTRSLNGAIEGDDVGLTGGTATYDTKNVGTNKTVTLTGASLNGVDAGNYTLSSVSTTTAAITALGLTGTFTVPPSKPYDATTAATVNTRSLSGVLGTETVLLTGGTATYDNKNVGTNKTVTLTGAALSGADAGNYTLSSVSTTTAAITAIGITGSFAVPPSKPYDRTTAATVSTRSLSGVLGTDAVSLTGGTATYDTKDVGTNKTITLSGASLDGADAGNYSLSSVSTTTAAITALGITGSFTVPPSKPYDATTAATVNGRNVSGVISPDVVTLTGGTATYDTKNVGTNKTVTLTGATLSGADAANYSLTSVSTTTAAITAIGITGSFTVPPSKPYDRTTAATVSTRSLSGALGTDVVSLTGGTATYDTKNVGTNKTVTLTGAALDGADAGNYTLTSVSTTTAAITALGITGTFTVPASKPYDATIGATVSTRNLSGVISPDVVTLTGGTATYDNKNVGTNKTVTLTGASLDGADAGNYSLSSVAATTAAITAIAITGSFTVPPSKPYDATTAATVSTRNLSGVLGTDVVTLNGGTAAYDNKNVGTNKTVTLSGATLTGTDGGNYTLSSVSTTTAAITALGITGSFTVPASKPYDGSTSATVSTRTLSAVLGSDVVSLTGGTATYDTKNVGTNKTVTLTGAALDGTDAGNYALTSVSTTTAAITAIGITGSFTVPASKPYDATTAATVSTRNLSGVISPDVVTLTGGTATYDNKNVGTNKTVTLTGATLNGADAGNYTLSSVSTTTAAITAIGITGSFTVPPSKPYDRTTAATASTRSVSGVLGSDVVSLNGGTATYDTKDVGTNKVVTLTGASLAGADAGNYILSSVSTTTAAITALGITGSFTVPPTRPYDGTTAAIVNTRSLSGVISPDLVTLTGGTAAYDNKNVGTNKTVTLTGAALSGADAANYSLSGVGTTTANITALGVTGTYVAANKVYDGNTVAYLSGPVVVGKLTGDVVSLTGGAGAFGDKNAGTNKSVTVSGTTLTGGDAANYSLGAVTANNADITPKAITITPNAGQSKVFGTLDPALTFTPTPTLVSGESFVTGTALSRAPGQDVGPYAITLGNLSAGTNYTLTLSATTVYFTITAASTSIVLTPPPTTQYSDGLTLTATVSPVLVGGSQLTGTVVFKVDGTTVGSPTAINASGVASLPIIADYTVGNHAVTATFTSTNSNYASPASPESGTLAVTKEDADFNYTGLMAVSTPSVSNNSAIVTLRASVFEVTDPSLGDITKATVTFVDRTVIASGTPITGCTNLAVVLLNGDPKTGTASCDWTATLGNGDDGAQFKIGVIVSGRYTDDDDVVINVSRPLNDFITGGGYVVNLSSGGSYAGNANAKTNFGFNVKTNKSGTNLQGNVTMIIRRNGRVYQVKSNAISSLNATTPQGPNPGVAQFSGKANLQDVTNPNAPVSITGNLSLQMTLTDKGEPGSNDLIGFTLWDGNTLVFSSSWTGTQTIEQLLGNGKGGGNVQVR